MGAIIPAGASVAGHLQSHDHSAAADGSALVPATLTIPGGALFTAGTAFPGGMAPGDLAYRTDTGELWTHLAGVGVVLTGRPGARNLVADGGWEFGGHWYNGGRNAIAPRSGAYNGFMTSAGENLFAQRFRVLPGVSYGVVGWGRGWTGNATAFVVHLRIRWFDATGAQISNDAVWFQAIGQDNTYREFTAAKTAPALADSADVYWASTAVSLPANVYLDDVEVYEFSGAVPRGGIIGYTGLVAAIPAGWFLCDGANGTPNLIDRMILGAASGNEGTSGGTVSASAALATHATHPQHGGAGSHSHATHAAHSTLGAHTIGGPSATQQLQAGTTSGAGSVVHTHALGAHGPISAHGAHDTEPSHQHDLHAAHDAHAIMKFYRLAWIMRS